MVIFPKSVKSLEDQTLRHFSRATKFFSKLSFVEASESHEKETAQTNTLRGPVYVEKVYRLGILYFEDWTGLDWTCKMRTCETRTYKTPPSETQTCKTRTQDRILRTSFFFFFFNFFRVCKSDKTER